jgi:16S rRNA processing protein RimM
MADEARPEDALEVGRIGDAWGLKGWFKVLAYASPPDALLSARRWHLQPSEQPSAPSRTAAIPGTLDVREVREHGDGLVAAAVGIDDRNAAEALRGARISIARSRFPRTATDEYYWADLIGLAVVNREGVALGTVAGLLDTGPHSVLRLVPAGPAEPADPAAERLIPFVSAYVDSVDLAARTIVVDWGLDY